MRALLKRIVRRLAPFAFLGPEGPQGIERRGHRGYVGGMWEEIGSLQFDFLQAQGLRPESYLLDVACGSLRLGAKAIPYLERGHYLGIEKERGLVRSGLEKEVGPELEKAKAPHIVVSSDFEFEKIGKRANYAIAQSLFTHLTPELIERCFSKLHPWLEEEAGFWATFHESEFEVRNPTRPHDLGHFAYTQAQMVGFGERAGFSASYIGEWNHPRNQVMVEYRKGAPRSTSGCTTVEQTNA